MPIKVEVEAFAGAAEGPTQDVVLIAGDTEDSIMRDVRTVLRISGQAER
ncbi:MAG: hypothetical protein WAL50_22030 [Kineosporiaceae bacterium]|jgi:hypothetical protein